MVSVQTVFLGQEALLVEIWVFAAPVQLGCGHVQDEVPLFSSEALPHQVEDRLLCSTLWKTSSLCKLDEENLRFMRSGMAAGAPLTQQNQLPGRNQIYAR
jgi:hypothetical protein